MIERPFAIDTTLPQLPRKQDNPPKPKRITSMTLAAAFENKEGVVFCADQQMSHGGVAEPGSFAHYETKVFSASSFLFWATAMCGSGNDAGLIRTFSQDFFKRLGQEEDEDGSLYLGCLRPAVEEILNDLSTKLNAIPSLQLLIGLTAPDHGVVFLKSDGLIVSKAGPVEVLGIGEQSLVRFLIDRAQPSKLNMRQAAVLACAVVWAGKEYCPQYCGGLTDVCLLYAGHKEEEWLERDEITEIERIFKENSSADFLRLLDQASKAIK
jgi:hypothetical protein